MNRYICMFTLLLLASSNSLAYNILGIFVHPGKSHFDMFQPMVQGLADNGHNLTVISMFPEANPPANYRDVVLNTIEGMKDGVDLKVRDLQHYNYLLHFIFSFLELNVTFTIIFLH